MQSPDYYIGLMSGTSLDGIDAALISIHSNQIQLIDFLTHPLPIELKTELSALNLTPNINLQQFCQLESAVAQHLIQATQALLKKSNFPAEKIRAIGSHGQTIFHAPEIPMSLQIGHPAFIAKQTGIPTVADFRIDDMANGGHGAPIAPAFHQFLFQAQAPLALVNIGGIANISFIGQKLQGFDTGPGNGIMDEVCQTYLGCDYDAQGQIADRHATHPELLSLLEQHPFFRLKAPKSTGRETFNLTWVENHLQEGSFKITPEALISTLNQLTVNTILQGLKQFEEKPKELLICGGGAYNATLIKRLQKELPFPVKTTADHLINPHALEAMMCAWLAHQRLNTETVPLKTITGAIKDSILGGVWQP